MCTDKGINLKTFLLGFGTEHAEKYTEHANDAAEHARVRVRQPHDPRRPPQVQVQHVSAARERATRRGP